MQPIGLITVQECSIIVDVPLIMQYFWWELLEVHGKLRTHGEKPGVKMDSSDWLEVTLVGSVNGERHTLIDHMN
jgi:hypothetical protein